MSAATPAHTVGYAAAPAEVTVPEDAPAAPAADRTPAEAR